MQKIVLIILLIHSLEAGWLGFTPHAGGGHTHKTDRYQTPNASQAHQSGMSKIHHYFTRLIDRSPGDPAPQKSASE